MQIKAGKVKIVIDDEYIIEGSIGSWNTDLKPKTGKGSVDLKIWVDNLKEKTVKGAAKKLGLDEEKEPAVCACGNPGGNTHQAWCPIEMEKNNA